MTISSVSSSSVSFASSDGARAFAQSQTSSVSFVPAKNLDAERESTVAQAPTPERIEQAVEKVNETFAKKGQNLHAAIEKDESTGISVVKVMDKETKEVISQFPSKEILAIAESIKQYQEDKGYLVNGYA